MPPELLLPEGLPSAWLLDCEVFAEAIRPDPHLTISEWADKYRMLSQESSAEHGQWRTDRVPHTREIMDSLSPGDPCTEVSFVAGAQIAKTETGNNFIGYIIDVAPGPAMMVYPTSSTGKRSSKTRLAKMIEAMPRLRAKISDRSRDKSNSASLKEFPGGLLVIAGANSAAELAMQPVRYLFMDELDKYPDDVDGQGPADKLAEVRTNTYRRNKKIFRTSTPTRLRGKGKSKIWAHYLQSDMRRRWVPCPHCQGEQVLRWAQFRWETRKAWEIVRDDDGEIVEVPEGTDGAKLRDTGELREVWYECEHCAGRIEERHKPWMFERGRWIADRPHIKHHKGYHLPSYYSPLGWFSWHQVVEQRLSADKDPTKANLKEWTNNVAGEPYADDGESINDLVLKNRGAGDGEKAYQLGVVPRFALMLTGGVDVQANRLEVKVKGWGRDKRSCVVDYQVIHGDTETSAPWAVLDEYLQKKFPHESGAMLPITATFVDAGYRTQTVYDWARLRGNRHIRACKGQSQPGKTIVGRPSKQDIDHNGIKIEGGIELWPIGTDTAKEEIYARLKIEKPGPGFMAFPLGLPDEYYKGLTSERRVTKYVRGYLVHVWEKDEVERNEPLDLEVYAYAAAIYAGLNRAPWDRMEAALLATAQDLFVEAERLRAEVAATATPEAPAPSVQTSAPPAAAPARGWLSPRRNWLGR